jgi:hypothetical protein
MAHISDDAGDRCGHEGIRCTLPHARAACQRIPRSRASGLVRRDEQVAVSYRRLEGLAQTQARESEPASARYARVAALGRHAPEPVNRLVTRLNAALRGEDPDANAIALSMALVAGFTGSFLALVWRAICSPSWAGGAPQAFQEPR